MEILALVIAFAFGFAVRQIALPPLVGYLAAGFVLHEFGFTGGATITTIADLGITLLLFTIGLKLRLRTLLRPEIWAVTSAHMIALVGLVVTGVLTAVALGALSGISFGGSLVIAFALSFSSTVFAVKVLEERGEMSALHGRIAIGILVMQDIFAVIYLSAAQGKLPSVYALALLLLPLCGPLLGAVMRRCGHGELMLLFGLTAAFGAAQLFEALALKGDLGALIMGVIIATTPQANELSKTLLGFKDILLIGFFLSIGLGGLPDVASMFIALALLALLPIKALMLTLLLLLAKLRLRTAVLGTLALTNYSEFGLIVMAIAVQAGVLPAQWTVIVALAVAGSFVIASPVNVFAHELYVRSERWLKRLERSVRLPGDELIDSGEAAVMICGMGRVGTAAYDEMHRRQGDTVVGVEHDEERAQAHAGVGRRVIHADVTDPDFWLKAEHAHLGMVVLAMPNHNENVFTASRLRARGFSGLVVATAQFADEVTELKAAGVSDAHNLREDAGIGLAELSSALYNASTSDEYLGERGLLD
ncbi:MAG: glutathione-regulated potassium-efflux system ancillary protein KefC [Gammaproteobacteria bacterium]|jgi:glutathione-regulated potassium-efflux system ancillary protein KefC